MKLKYMLLSALLTPFLVNAQETWSLERCIEHAMTNNIDVKQQQLSLKNSETDLLGAKGNFLPSVNASATHGYNWGRSVDAFTNTFTQQRVRSNNFSVNAQMNLFSGFRNYNTYQKSKIDLLAGKEDVNTTKNNIALSVASNYLDILFNIERLAIAQRQTGVTKQQLTRTKKLVEAGSSPKGDMLQIQSQLANEELNVVNIENTLTLSYLRLKQSMLLPSDAKVEIAIPANLETSSMRLPAGPNTVVQAAYDSYPSIKSLGLKVTSAEKGISIARGLSIPTLSVRAGLSTGYSSNVTELVNLERREKSFNDQLSDNYSRNLIFSLNVPIFTRFSNYNSLNRARVGHENAKLQLEREKNKIRSDVEKAFTDAMAAFKKFNATKKSLESFKEAYKYAKQRFEVGLINAVDHNTAKNNLNKAESDLLQAKYEYIFRVKILDFYQGKPLKM